MRGRNFFFNDEDSDIAYIFIKKGKLYMHNEYNKSDMYLHTKFGYPPNNWHHGGTLWSLTKDFVDFIRHGGETNHNHGYGGLFCPFWGYPERDMKIVQRKAYELGYLK